MWFVNIYVLTGIRKTYTIYEFLCAAIDIYALGHSVKSISLWKLHLLYIIRIQCTIIVIYHLDLFLLFDKRTRIYWPAENDIDLLTFKSILSINPIQIHSIYVYRWYKSINLRFVSSFNMQFWICVNICVFFFSF